MAKFNSKAYSEKINLKCAICSKDIALKKSFYNKHKKKENITCSFACAGIIQRKTRRGRNNPNCKYKFDDFLFENIDSQDKAYLLGWIGSDGNVAKDGRIEIGIKSCDEDILVDLRDIICNDLPIKRRRGLSFLTFCSKQMMDDICRHLSILPGKKDFTVRMPILTSDMTWHFIRGYFDGDGSVRNPDTRKHVDCNISSCSYGLKYDILNFCGIHGSVNRWAVGFSGKNAMLFMDNIYSNANKKLKRKFDRYSAWKAGNFARLHSNKVVSRKNLKTGFLIDDGIY